MFCRSLCYRVRRFVLLLPRGSATFTAQRECNWLEKPALRALERDSPSPRTLIHGEGEMGRVRKKEESGGKYGNCQCKDS